MNKWKSVHVWTETYKMIRMLAALRGVTHGELINELAKREYVQLGLDKMETQPQQEAVRDR